MKYKLIAVDMDGTLLNSEGKISDKTASSIQKVMEKGILFTISTGRPIQGIEKYNNQLHLNGPVITYNGAMIVNAVNKEVLFKKDLTREDALSIFELGKSLKMTMCIWSNNQLYGYPLNEKVHDYKKLSDVKANAVDNFEDLLDNGITKILWYDSVEGIENILKDLKPNMFNNTTYCTSKPYFLEFFSKDVSKSRAMEKIGELYNIKPEEMVAIGDGLNDLSMIQYAGLGVAMANAHEDVKKQSQFITQSNDDDGVGKLLDLILNDYEF